MPGLPAIVIVVPSPTTFILLPVGGTAPPVFPVSVSTTPLPFPLMLLIPA